MSVTLPNRNESSAQFINDTFLLNQKIGSAYAKMSNKYRSLYGLQMVNNGLEALKHLQIGNGIYLDQYTPENMFNIRQQHFAEAKGLLYNIPTIYRLYVRVRIETENPSSSVKIKWIEQGKATTDICNRCVDLIGGAIRSDKQRYKDYQKGNVEKESITKKHFKRNNVGEQ